jgi:hypothetical protein
VAKSFSVTGAQLETLSTIELATLAAPFTTAVPADTPTLTMVPATDTVVAATDTTAQPLTKIKTMMQPT